jgi:hypothetical protein
MKNKHPERKGLKTGDSVIPTKKYLEIFADKDNFEAIIDRFSYDDVWLPDIAFLKYTKSNQPYRLHGTWAMSTHWLQKNPCVYCPLGIDKICVSADE